MTAPELHVVCVLTSAERGGGEYATVHTLEALAARGARVTLLTDQPALADGTPVPVVPVALGPKLSRRSVVRVAVSAPLIYARLAGALRRVGRGAPAPVLLAPYKKEQLLAALLPPGLVRAIVWLEHGPLPAELARGPARAAYAAAARRARGIIAVSEGTKRSLAAAGVDPAAVTVVPPVAKVDGVRFDPDARARRRTAWGATEDTFVIGCVSRLQARKRNDVVIDALDHMAPDTMLVIAGDGEEEPALRRRAARFGDRVIFLPAPGGAVAEVLSACDVQVFAPGPTEGAPLAITYGQLAERPVVATAPAGADGMIAGGAGTIVSPPNDSRALAACLEEYRADPGRREREGRRGREAALARHDPDALAGAVEQVLRRAAGG